MSKNLTTVVQACLALFSLYFCYDIPAALDTELVFADNRNRPAKISLLYAAYALPNICAPVVFTHFVAKRRLVPALAVLVLGGQLIFTAGAVGGSFLTMVVGRLVLGLGGESFAVIQSSIILGYFRGRKPTIAIGIFNGVMRLGILFTFVTTPTIALRLNCLAACIFSLAILGSSMFFYIRTFLKEENTAETTRNSGSKEVNIEVGDELKNTEESGSQLNLPFKILVVISFLFGMGLAPFYSVAPIIFQKHFEVRPPASSRMVSYIEIISLTLFLLIGPASDVFGLKLLFLAFGSLIMVSAHMAILYRLRLIPIIFALGVGTPLVARFWPCIPLIVPSETIELALSVVYCVLNFAYAASPLIVAYLVTKDPFFDLLEKFISILYAAAFVLVFVLWGFDRRYGLGLNRPEKHLSRTT